MAEQRANRASLRETYQAFVRGQQHCDASVDLANRQGDKHGRSDGREAAREEKDRTETQGREERRQLLVEAQAAALWLGTTFVR